ncbi:lipocalin family protein [Allomuricauda sp. d1]|uniref:lipocalin family protein n=1 Tax=Allomuricauda sp. d1 TaxID=3136725 RepID=UPI0031D431E9
MMKNNWILAAVFSAILFSCSSDSDDNDGEMLDSNTLVGTWEMTEVRFADSNNTSLNLVLEIANNLIEEDCDILTLTFNSDGTAVSESKLNNFDVGAVGTGLSVPCPESTDSETTTWDLEGNQLTFIDSDMMEETITVDLNGDTLIVDGVDFDENNLEGTEIIFTRQ